MQIKSLCFITDKYPTDEYPANTFLDKLVSEIAKTGIECTVISAYSVTEHRLHRTPYNPPYHRIKTLPGGKKINIYSPRFVTLSNKKLLNTNTAYFGINSMLRAVRKTVKKENIDPDAFYGHFILPSGICSAKMGRLTGKPSFLAYGESSIKIIDCLSKDYVRDVLSKLSGVIAVSGKNRDELIENAIVPPDKIQVFPNGADPAQFRPLDRGACRKELGFDKDDFIIAFNGAFIERKGVLRVIEAIKKVGGVQSIFIGSGEQNPDCDGILFKGRLPHEKICTYLCAADAFVLPTLNEGCCNAIVEALSCSLPVISSSLSFNDEILDESCSIRINPDSVDEIASAIKLIKDDPQTRERLAEGAEKKAKGLTISARANNIIAFLDEKANI